MVTMDWLRQSPAPDLAESSIVCRDLTKVYRGAPPAPAWASANASPNGSRPQAVRAVDELNLTVGRGEFFGLLGPNGAGKSTTIGMLTTRVVPTAGQAFVEGVDVVRQAALARTKLAAVTQTNTLDRSLTVFDNLYFHGRYFGLSRADSRQRAHALIERLSLADKANEMVDTLSGGLAQRVQIARALLHAPAVIFLDEPTAGLDPQSRLSLWDLVRELNAEGHTILLTTHDMDEADTLCERIAIVDHGHLLALDTPANLKASVGAQRIVTVTTAEAVGADTTAKVRQLSGITRVEGEANTLRVYADVEEGLVLTVVNAVTGTGAHLRDLSVAEPTLEAVYLQLTGREYRA